MPGLNMQMRVKAELTDGMNTLVDASMDEAMFAPSAWAGHPSVGCMHAL